jgi:methylated-DNA-[protein]-cysteine S-methyltransferase
MTLNVWTTATPIGPWSVVAEAAVVLASGFAPADDIIGRLGKESGAVAAEFLPRVSDAVERYLAGEVNALDDIEVRQPGGPYQQQVWHVMRGIPAGTTWSYAQLATKSGRPVAVRAAATACSRNLVAPFVPCHRVVKSDGSLGGYYYGLEIKEWLLRHERKVRL